MHNMLICPEWVLWVSCFSISSNISMDDLLLSFNEQKLQHLMWSREVEWHASRALPQTPSGEASRLENALIISMVSGWREQFFDLFWVGFVKWPNILQSSLPIGTLECRASLGNISFHFDLRQSSQTMHPIVDFCVSWNANIAYS